MMKKLSKIIVGGTVALILSLSVSTFVYALNDYNYTVLTPLPGTTNCADGSTPKPITIDQSGNVSGGCTTNFSTYLPAMFKLAMGISAVLAFVMITYGGLLYMTTDAIGSKSKAKEYIENAIWGLVLVIGSWVILNTINPQLLKLDLNISVPKTQAQDTITAGVQTLTGNKLVNNTALINTLAQSGIYTKSSADVIDLQKSAISGVIGLATAAGCPSSQPCVVINEGTDGSHSTMTGANVGKAVDLQANTTINNIITNNFKARPSSTTSDGCPIYSYGGASYLFEKNRQLCGGTIPSTGDHWHATYP